METNLTLENVSENNLIRYSSKLVFSMQFPSQLVSQRQKKKKSIANCPRHVTRGNLELQLARPFCNLSRNFRSLLRLHEVKVCSNFDKDCRDFLNLCTLQLEIATCKRSAASYNGFLFSTSVRQLARKTASYHTSLIFQQKKTKC